MSSSASTATAPCMVGGRAPQNAVQLLKTNYLSYSAFKGRGINATPDTAMYFGGNQPMYMHVNVAVGKTLRGVTTSKGTYPTGGQYNPRSMNWGNNGNLKIPAQTVLKHKPDPFVVLPY